MVYQFDIGELGIYLKKTIYSSNKSDEIDRNVGSDLFDISMDLFVGINIANHHSSFKQKKKDGKEIRSQRRKVCT